MLVVVWLIVQVYVTLSLTQKIKNTAGRMHFEYLSSVVSLYVQFTPSLRFFSDRSIVRDVLEDLCELALKPFNLFWESISFKIHVP